MKQTKYKLELKAYIYIYITFFEKLYNVYSIININHSNLILSIKHYNLSFSGLKL